MATEPDRNSRPSVGSGEYYANATDTELEYQVRGNMAGSRAHDGAMAELERRRSARAGAIQLRWIKWTLATTVLLGAAGIIATIAD